MLIALTGDAVGVAAPEISTDKTSLSFGPVAVGAQSTVQELWLTNIGLTNLNVSAITIAAPFALATGTCYSAPFSLTPGQACLLQLQFSPTSPGAPTGTLTFASNAGELSVALAGEAVAAPPGNQIVAVGGSAPSNTGGGGSAHPAVVCVLLLALGVIARRSAPNA